MYKTYFTSFFLNSCHIKKCSCGNLFDENETPIDRSSGLSKSFSLKSRANKTSKPLPQHEFVLRGWWAFPLQICLFFLELNPFVENYLIRYEFENELGQTQCSVVMFEIVDLVCQQVWCHFLLERNHFIFTTTVSLN